MNYDGSPTVLVVDDAPDSLSLINDTLERAGIDTLVALEGRQALSIANRMKPDMILLDALMPNMDGFETCRRLKSDPGLSSIPVIFMTGLSDTESLVRGLDAGGVDYLTKPVNPNELLARMRVHLKNADIARSAQQALDNAGQRLFSVAGNGQLNWATPHAYALFAKRGATENWLGQVLAPALERWLPLEPGSGQRFPLNDSGVGLEINFLEKRNPNEFLLKVSEVEEQSGEEQLRETLDLTKRESEVLYWLAKGKTNKEIALILEMSARTVNKHLEQVFPKLGVENRTAAAGIAIRILEAR